MKSKNGSSQGQYNSQASEVSRNDTPTTPQTNNNDNKQQAGYSPNTEKQETRHEQEQMHNERDLNNLNEEQENTHQQETKVVPGNNNGNYIQSNAGFAQHVCK